MALSVIVVVFVQLFVVGRPLPGQSSGGSAAVCRLSSVLLYY